MTEHDHGLYRRPGSKFWWMSFYCPDENGRAVKMQRSTKETSKVKARKVRDATTGAIANGARPHHAEKVLFADLERVLLANYRVKGNKSTDRALRALSHLREAFGGWKAVHITAKAIDTYLLDRTETASLATVYYELSILKRAFHLAVRTKELPHVPTFPEMGTVDNVREGFFTDAEVALLQVELPNYLRGLAMFAYLTSWRRLEMLGLKWSHVDFDEGVLRLEGQRTKSGKPRTFPFKSFPQLRAVLESQREYSEMWEDRTGRIVTHVFTNRGKPIKDHYAAWRSACKRAGLEGRILHDMRRSAVRNFDRAGIPRDIAKKLSGHKTDTMYTRYNIVDDQDLDDATAKLGRREAGEKIPPETNPGDITGTSEPKSRVKVDWGPGA